MTSSLFNELEHAFRRAARHAGLEWRESTRQLDLDTLRRTWRGEFTLAIAKPVAPVHIEILLTVSPDQESAWQEGSGESEALEYLGIPIQVHLDLLQPTYVPEAMRDQWLAYLAQISTASAVQPLTLRFRAAVLRALLGPNQGSGYSIEDAQDGTVIVTVESPNEGDGQDPDDDMRKGLTIETRASLRMSPEVAIPNFPVPWSSISHGFVIERMMAQWWIRIAGDDWDAPDLATLFEPPLESAARVLQATAELWTGLLAEFQMKRGIIEDA